MKFEVDDTVQSFYNTTHYNIDLDTSQVFFLFGLILHVPFNILVMSRLVFLG